MNSKRFFLKINFLFFLFLLFLFSCESKVSKEDISKAKNIKNFFVKIENLAGEFTIDSTHLHLYELRKNTFSGEFNTNSDGTNFNLSFKNILGECTLLLNKGKNIFVESLVANGKLKILGNEIKLERLEGEINGGEIELYAGKSTKFVKILNNFGNLLIKIPRKSKVKLALAVTASQIEIPEEFNFSDGIYYYNFNGYEKETIELELILNFGNLQISFI